MGYGLCAKTSYRDVPSVISLVLSSSTVQFRRPFRRYRVPVFPRTRSTVTVPPSLLPPPPQVPVCGTRKWRRSCLETWRAPVTAENSVSSLRRGSKDAHRAGKKRVSVVLCAQDSEEGESCVRARLIRWEQLLIRLQGSARTGEAASSKQQRPPVAGGKQKHKLPRGRRVSSEYVIDFLGYPHAAYPKVSSLVPPVARMSWRVPGRWSLAARLIYGGVGTVQLG